MNGINASTEGRLFAVPGSGIRENKMTGIIDVIKNSMGDETKYGLANRCGISTSGIYKVLAGSANADTINRLLSGLGAVVQIGDKEFRFGFDSKGQPEVSAK